MNEEEMNSSDEKIINECQKIILDCGLRPDSFSLSHHNKPMPSPGIHFSNGELLVKEKSSRKQKIYTTGHMAFWQDDLEVDLKKGFFK